MTLETLTPDPDWEPEDHSESIEVLSGLDSTYVFRVWGDDGCKDCIAQLPGFAAALAAAGIADEQVVEYAVERLPDGKKRGPQVEAYGIERIPTVVVERDGVEIARYVEDAAEPIAEYLASAIKTADAKQ